MATSKKGREAITMAAVDNFLCTAPITKIAELIAMSVADRNSPTKDALTIMKKLNKNFKLVIITNGESA